MRNNRKMFVGMVAAAALAASGSFVYAQPQGPGYGPGNCAQSVFGRSSALYYRHEATPGFTIMISRSLAADVWRALCITAASDGYDVGLPAAFDAA